MTCVCRSLAVLSRLRRTMSDAAASIAQRLSGLQHMLYALLSLALSTERHESLTLQIQQVLLRHHRLTGEIAAGNHGREFPGDMSVVFRDVAASNHHVNSELDRRQRGFSQHGNVRSRMRLNITLSYHSKSGLLCVFNQAIPVHRDLIRISQETDFLSLDGGR